VVQYVGSVNVNISGDIGGAGISRFHFTRFDDTLILPADANAAGAAVKALYNSLSANLPSALSWAINPVVQLWDQATGLVQGSVAMSSPPGTVGGIGSGSYGAGLGIRINWTSSTPLNRRLMRSATYIVPLTPNAFGSNGAVNAAVINTAKDAAITYLNAMTTAQLAPVSWHRPAKGTTSGGVTGMLIGANVPATPSGLRSRRS